MKPLAVGLIVGIGLCGLVRGTSGAVPARADDPPANQTAAQLYAESPGRMEFSGRLLVRPLQAGARGAEVTPEQDALARALIDPYILEHLDGIDIYVVVPPAGHTENTYGAELLATGLYEWVRPDWILYPLGSGPNDPDYPLQWHLRRINAPGAWRFTTGAPNIVVAFVDTGVDLTHPDLAPLLVAGFNSHWSWRIGPPAHNAGGKVSDDNGHGTSVAGAGIAVANNNSGGCGVAWNLRIMPIRATNPGTSGGGASSSDIIAGAKWAVDHGAKVVSGSWTGVAEPNIESLGQYVRARGALLVWAMDQSGQATTFDHPNVVVVNGTNQDDALYDPSCNWGPGVDLAAPAKDLWIPTKGGGYGWKMGNSYCTPIVAACAGLVWSLDPALTPLQVEHALEWSAKDIGPPGQDNFFGYGRVDPYIAAVNVLLGNVGYPHQPQFVTAEDIVNAQNQWHVDR